MDPARNPSSGLDSLPKKRTRSLKRDPPIGSIQDGVTALVWAGLDFLNWRCYGDNVMQSVTYCDVNVALMYLPKFMNPCHCVQWQGFQTVTSKRGA